MWIKGCPWNAIWRPHRGREIERRSAPGREWQPAGVDARVHFLVWLPVSTAGFPIPSTTASAPSAARRSVCLLDAKSPKYTRTRANSSCFSSLNNYYHCYLYRRRRRPPSLFVAVLFILIIIIVIIIVTVNADSRASALNQITCIKVLRGWPLATYVHFYRTKNTPFRRDDWLEWLIISLILFIVSYYSRTSTPFIIHCGV